MEDPDSNELDDWLAGQAAYARGALDRLAHRQALLARIRELGRSGGGKRRH